MSRTLRILCFSFLALGFVACGDKDDTGTPDCGEGGDWDDDHGHCHCDDGYSLADGGNSCEPNGAGDTGE